MTFTESIKTCFSKYFTFAGRASRSEFWYFMLFCLLGNTILPLFDGFVLGMSSIQPASSMFVLVIFYTQYVQPPAGCMMAIIGAGGN